MDMYKKVYTELFAMPGIVGRKSESEKFAGADVTLTYETLMPEGKALQSCTSHDLGQNFSKPFEITYQSDKGTNEYAWQTSWGLSTRSIGGMIMAHGDDGGLRLPPRLAPIQTIVLPVRAEENVKKESENISAALKDAGIRVRVDDAENESIGFRINKWELKGVPLRIEVGPKELEKKVVTVVRRDTGEKMQLPIKTLEKEVTKLLDDIQYNLLQEAENFLHEHTHSTDSYAPFKEIMKESRGFISALWCEDPACEQKIKEDTKATTRCMPLDTAEERGSCVSCGKSATHRWYFAQSY